MPGARAELTEPGDWFDGGHGRIQVVCQACDEHVGWERMRWHVQKKPVPGCSSNMSRAKDVASKHVVEIGSVDSFRGAVSRFFFLSGFPAAARVGAEGSNWMEVVIPEPLSF